MKKCAIVLWLCAILCASACSPNEQGFEIRGTKGYDWTPEQCLEEVPYLKEFGMNFFAPCYLSFFSEHGRNLSSMKELSGLNKWWLPFSDKDKQDWAAVVEECLKDDIYFCFGMNPMLYSPRPLSVKSEEDYSVLLEKYKWFQSLGVKWFYLALDDLELEGQAEIAAGHFHFVNRLYHDLKQKDPDCKMVFCPTWYRGRDVDNPIRRPYLDALAELLDPDVFLFWTGENVVSTTISAADVRKYKSVVKHRIILWDNYPVNDFYNTLYLGPLTGRDADICQELYGMMSNPMRDSRLNRLPLSTIADYMNAPASYDEQKALAKALRRFCPKAKDRKVFASLVEIYSSNMVAGHGKTSYNAAREKFTALVSEDRQKAEKLAEELRDDYNYLLAYYPDRYILSYDVMRKDLDWMSSQLGEYSYKVGYGSAPIDAADAFFSQALQGYGHPAEGRYSLEWIHDGTVDVNEPLSFFGGGDDLFSLDIGGDLYRYRSGAWQKLFSTNEVSLLAGAVPESYKLLCAGGDALYGVSLNNHLSTSTLDLFERKEVCVVPDAVAITASDEGVYVFTSSSELVFKPSDLKLKAEQIGKVPFDVRSAAWYEGRLYALSSDQHLWVNEPSAGKEWAVAGYLNGETWKEAIKYIAVAGGHLFGIGFDGSLYRASDRSRGDLYARTITINEGPATVALVSLDLGAINYQLVKEIKKTIQSSYGLDPASVLISVTHTHFAPAAMDWEMFPGGKADARYLSFLKDAVVRSVGDALGNMAPAEAGFRRTSEELGYNRGLKGADAVTDPAIDVIDFRRADGRTVVLFEAACHPVFPNSGNNRYTLGANYPGVARQIIEESKDNIFPVFFQGCCGDTDPVSQDYNETGKALAGKVLEALKGESKEVNGGIRFMFDSLAVPVHAMSLKEVRGFLVENSGRSLDIEAIKNVKWAKKMLAAYGNGTVKTHQTEYYQLIDIGNWRIVALSREPVKEYALRIRELWPEKNVTVLGYSNDVSSYLTDDKHVEEGTYESHDSFFWYGEHAPFPKGTLDKIVSAIKTSVPD